MEWYDRKICKFLSNNRDSIFTTRGIQIFSSVGCGAVKIHRAEHYKLPQEIIQLVSLKYIYKLYAEPIELWIDTHLEFIYFNILSINGVELHTGGPDLEFTCDGCNTRIEKYWERWAIEEEDQDLCESCYDNGIYGEFAKEDYVRYYISDINFLDWVPFMKSHGDIWLVNCNTGSHYYGHIAVISFIDNTYCRFNILYNNTYGLVADICKWMNTSGEFITNPMDLFDNPYVLGEYTTYRGPTCSCCMLYNYGRYVDENRDAIEKKIAEKKIYKDPKHVSFSGWTRYEYT